MSAGRILSRTRPHRPRAGRRMSRLRVPQLGSQTMRRPPRQPRLVASERLPSVISHVIPWRLLQTMNSRRCNCNVCGASQKLTKVNYVRLWVKLPEIPAGSSCLAPASRVLALCSRLPGTRARNGLGVDVRNARRSALELVEMGCGR